MKCGNAALASWFAIWADAALAASQRTQPAVGIAPERQNHLGIAGDPWLMSLAIPGRCRVRSGQLSLRLPRRLRGGWPQASGAIILL
jgi:hypothetical protein